MAARIERQVADQRALLATVSHEIRSPLARIRLHTELAREADAATTTTHLDAVDDEVAAVDRLVGDLLAGSRIDFGALTRSAHTPAELATSALEAAETPPEVLSVDEDLPELSVDVTLVVRALANLLQNARRHGGGVASFSVAAAGTGTGVSFTVQDRGPGLRSGDEERVFEPFYRSAVREGFAAPDGPSTGLGLALVKRIVEAHGGTVTGQNAPEGGAAFTILLPSTPAV
jgi:signal transduction histidine kinase